MINWTELNSLKEVLLKEIDNIFKVYGYEIEIKAEDLNLLKSKYSCLRTSTALGYILEEFVYQKFKNVFKNNKDWVIWREGESTQNSSYDFVLSCNKFDALINIKTENINSQNNAVAAINKLHFDYEKKYNSGKDFYYILLKVIYSIDNKQTAMKTETIEYYKKMQIQRFTCYALEEVSFINGHNQDSRNWSNKGFKKESGRLIISDSFLKKNRLNEEQEISNYQTLHFIESMYETKTK
ncbi:hypothetical protein GE118_04020 [Mycoplasma sp. NEAQ87857]|uniref:UpaP162 family type II restriction enzyme n=1 Tax=Mycoplasma sp. NEAQ87857 TaxID=2683967 RepID=UPI001316A65A|nr:hypothetical protein [Mycoplasma sp. NEAQ87857]QGZ97943.1 hypothetical protein GE118_04020 [Mycoplasma sp. NEAQ87857]